MEKQIITEKRKLDLLRTIFETVLSEDSTSTNDKEQVEKTQTKTTEENKDAANTAK